MKHNFEKFCKCYKNIENYEKAKADNFKGWHCHHRLETHNSDGERRLVDITQKELIALGMYYHRPPEELIFLTIKEHGQLHQTGKKRSEETKKKIAAANIGKHLSEEAKKKIAEAKKGENHPNYGKHLSEETKKKISESVKGKHRSEEMKKKMSEVRKGKHHSEETKKKISETCKSLHWYNNGKINTMAKECPGGFVPGRLLI